MAAPEQRNIEWGTADVEDATLSLQLSGASSKAWKQRFDSVLTLLDSRHGRWGEVHLNKKGIRVVEVQPGTESELRHFLETVVLQANSELPQPEGPGQDAEAGTHVDEAAQTDRQMTAAFRAFAED